MDNSSGYARSQGPSLFVGGLAFNATEQDVREAFAPCGTITSCRIVTDRETGRSKGFGFVEFASEDSIERAVRDYNGMTICGRQVRLDSGGKGKGKGGASRGGYDQQNRDAGRPRAPYGQQESRGGYQGGSYGESQGGYQRGGGDYQQSGGYKQGGGYHQQEGGYGGYKQGGGYQQEGGYQQGGYQASGYQQGGPGGYQSSQTGGYQRDHQSYSREQPQEHSRRSRSRSLSSGTKERRHRERQARKDEFARSNRGWDRMPTSEEAAFQEAERAAVHAAEAQGKDITTIRADLLKQQSYAHHH